MEENAKEQKEEQVVDTTPVTESNPVQESAPEKIPESSESSETQNAAETQKKPHHIEDPEEIAKREGDPSEVKINLDEVEFGEDGLPVLTQIDIDRLKNSGLTISDFTNEVEYARLQYQEADKAIKEGEEDDKRIAKELRKLRKQLKEEQDEEKKKPIQEEIDSLNAEKKDLPKYNPKLLKELETSKRNSIKLIATYQNLSRKSILKLQQDGSLLALVSSSADAVFLSAYTNACLTSVGKGKIEDDEEIKKAKERMKVIEDKYTRLDYLFKNYETAKNRELVKEINDFIKSVPETDTEGRKFIDEVITCTNRIPRVDVYPKEVIAKAEERLHELSIESMNFGTNEEVQDLDDVKNEETAREKFIDNVKDYIFACASFGFVYKMYRVASHGTIRGKFSVDPSTIVSPFPMAFSAKTFDISDSDFEKWCSEVEIIRPEYDKVREEYEKLDDEIYDKIVSISDEYKKTIKEDSLANAYLEYALIQKNTGFDHDKNKNFFTFENVLSVAANRYELITYLMSNSERSKEIDEFKAADHTAGSLQMIPLNIYKYFTMLKDTSNLIDADYASKFDPESVLKDFYYDNKNAIDIELDNVEKAKKEFASAFMYNGSEIVRNLHYRIGRYIVDHASEIDKITAKDGDSENKKKQKKHKNPFEAIERFSVLNSYMTTLEEFFKNPKVKEFVENYDKIIDEYGDEKLTQEEFDAKLTEKYSDVKEEAVKSIVELVIFNAFGTAIVSGFNSYYDHFISNNENKAIGEDCTKYLIHEFILTYDALKDAKADSSIIDYINQNAKNVAFKGLSFEYQKYADLNNARRLFIINILQGIAETLKEVGDGLVETVKNKEEAEKNREENRIKRNKKKGNKSKKELEEERIKALKKRKELAKQRRRDAAGYKDLQNEYSSLINDGVEISNGFTFLKPEGRYFVTVSPAKDTRVKLNVIFTKRIPEGNSISKFFEQNIIDKNVSTSVKKAFNVSGRINEDKMMNLGEKWYYNQFSDGSLNLDENKNILKSENIDNFTISQLCRFITNSVLISGNTRIIDKISDLVISSGVEFTEKEIVIKNNCKFDIKYFNGSKMSDFIKGISDNGNLNFFNTKTWFAVSFELHYDLANKKIEEEVKTEEVKENKKKNRAPVSEEHLEYSKLMSGKGHKVDPSTIKKKNKFYK